MSRNAARQVRRNGRRVGQIPGPGSGTVRRRGVASVLAMMFIVMFGSLAAVMAVVAQGNLRTAQSHLQVTRALSAAETGLTFASRRLNEAAARFVVEKGTVTSNFGEHLWMGTWDNNDGSVTILPPKDFVESPMATSIATALANAHGADEHNLVKEAGDELLPAVDEFGKVVIPPIGVEPNDDALYFRLSYEPLADGRFIRITSVGYDGTLTRTVQMDYQIVKRLDAAIISPTRIMIGKNVHIDGPIGSRYGEDPADLAEENGHPLVMRSDFKHLNAELDGQIDALIDSIGLYDVNGDNRLRPGHPSEQAGLTEPYMVDVDGDGFVDDYDLWLGYYDANDDQQICYDQALAYSAGYGTMEEEFVDVDDQLVEMIDSIQPDRNGDGVVDEADVTLGYHDGVINSLDGYSKVSGHLLFKAIQTEWESANGGASFQEFVNGPIRSAVESAATQFEVPDEQLYDLTIADFGNAQDVLKGATASSPALADQLATQLGEDPGTHTWTDSPDQPDYLRPDIGLWEKMPVGSPGFYDWYQRPIYKNMTFVDVKIPMGTNALFRNCTFIGAVYVETYTANENVNWNYLGMKDKVGDEYVDKYDFANMEPPLIINGDQILDTKPYSNNLRFDSCTFVGSVVSDPATELTHVRNKVQFTGTTRFTLDESEIDNSHLTDEEKQSAHEQFAQNKPELEKSSLLAPNFSVDVGSFDNAAEKVQLQGTIVAGILDIRGRADVVGTLLMTFKPVAGEGPLYYGGSVAAFNTTLGYFSLDEGDGEGGNGPGNGYGNITLRYDPEIPLPDGINAPVKTVPVRGSYYEGHGDI